MDMVPRNRPSGNLTRRSQHPFEVFRHEFDNLFNRWLAPFDEDFGTQAFWNFDVQEKDKEIIVRADLPGFDENEVNVELDNDTLTIRAEKQHKGEGEESYRSFYRSVTVPPGIEPDKAQATYHNGVLELHLPRPEGTRGRRIPIQGHQGQPRELGQQTQGSEAGKSNGSNPAGKQASPAQGKEQAGTAGKK